MTSKRCENENLVSFICFSFLAVIPSTVFGNFCDCRLLCLHSGMNLANLSTRMEMRSAKVKYCKLSVLQAFFKGSRERQSSQNEPKKDRVSRLLQM